jgi:hypothetical protein
MTQYCFRNRPVPRIEQDCRIRIVSANNNCFFLMDLPSVPELVGCRPGLNTIGYEICVMLVQDRAVVINCLGVYKILAVAV